MLLLVRISPRTWSKVTETKRKSKGKKTKRTDKTIVYLVCLSIFVCSYKVAVVCCYAHYYSMHGRLLLRLATNYYCVTPWNSIAQVETKKRPIFLSDAFIIHKLLLLGTKREALEVKYGKVFIYRL